MSPTGRNDVKVASVYEVSVYIRQHVYYRKYNVCNRHLRTLRSSPSARPAYTKREKNGPKRTKNYRKGLANMTKRQTTKLFTGRTISRWSDRVRATRPGRIGSGRPDLARKFEDLLIRPHPTREVSNTS